MMATLTDELIRHLLVCPKRVTNAGARWKVQSGSSQKNFDLKADSGESFVLCLRQNQKIIDGFSCVLRFVPLHGDAVVLARYNGSDHPHSNPIERTRFSFHCHIHIATERYIAIGRKPEHYAEPTDRYRSLSGALEAIATDCSISGLPRQARPPNQDLFD